MPYADNAGIRIYYEVEGKGPPLVLLQGWSCPLQLWRYFSYVETLKRDHRLILIDARGHGGSDKPHDAKAYRLERMVADVVAVLDDLNIRKAHYWGYSMGGWVGFGIAAYAIERFRSLIIGGYQPDWGRPQQVEGFFQIVEGGMDALLALWKTGLGSRMTTQLEQMALGNDLEALKAIMEAMTVRYDLQEALSTLPIPCLLYVGENDGHYTALKETSKRMPSATFTSLPGLDHFSAIVQSDLVLPHVCQFLSEVSQATLPTE